MSTQHTQPTGQNESGAKRKQKELSASPRTAGEISYQVLISTPEGSITNVSNHTQEQSTAGNN